MQKYFRQPSLSYSSMRTRKWTSRIFIDGIMLSVVLFMALPFMWIISTSLRLPRDSFSLPPVFYPTSFNWQNYLTVFQAMPFLDFIFNSIKVTVIIVLGHVIISSMAAYAFARIQFPGRDVMFIVILSGLMIPHQATIIPQFIMMSRVGLIDTHTSLILLGMINPIGIFLIRQMMLSISKSYDEAAFIDGANRFWVFIKVIFPMAMPAIAVSSVMWFVINWNDFFRPLIFLNSVEKMTLPLGMTALSGVMGTGNLSVILAGVTVSLIAPMLFYIFGQKYLVEGISSGGVKG